MLSQYRTEQLQQVVNIIMKAVSPEKIFLLGAAQHGHLDESIFTPAPVQLQQVVHYSLLVLTRENDGRCFDTLQDVIESRCRHATPVTAILEAMHIVNQWIDAGHPFAVQVAVNGLQVYDKGDVALHVPPRDFYEPDIMAQQKEYQRWNNQIAEFMAGTELYLLRKQFGLAAFLLHQAAEHAYTILMKTMTGYRPSTHNLDKLVRYCQPFSAKLAAVFPRNNDKENNLFQLLQKAYVHGRYRDDYVITEKELQVLVQRVKLLQDVTRQIIENKLSECLVAVV
jgi:uncharacterized protein